MKKNKPKKQRDKRKPKKVIIVYDPPRIREVPVLSEGALPHYDSPSEIDTPIKDIKKDSLFIATGKAGNVYKVLRAGSLTCTLQRVSDKFEFNMGTKEVKSSAKKWI